MMFLATLKAKLIAIVGGVVAVLGILFAVRQSGKKAARDEIKADTVDKIIEVSTKEKEIEKVNNDLGAKSRRDELLKYASDSGRVPVDKHD